MYYPITNYGELERSKENADTRIRSLSRVSCFHTIKVSLSMPWGGPEFRKAAIGNFEGIGS